MSQHLIIDQKAARLEIEGLALKIHRPERKVSSIPLRLIEQVTLVANIEISVHLLHRLAQQGISVAIMNPRNQAVLTEYINPTHKAYQRRAKQYALMHDEQAAVKVARELISAKLKSQARHLHQLSLLQPENQGFIKLKCEAIQALRTPIAASNRQEILGLEGSAARHYFEAYRCFFAEHWQFHCRNKRPPKDPVNSLLSLGYSLLIREASHALQRAGLDPVFGFYHRVTPGRHSLACDLAELYRTHVDGLVYQLLAQQKLKQHHFGYQLDACLLTKEGRARFSPAYQKGMAACRRAMRIEANQWVKKLMAAPYPEWLEGAA